MYTTLFYGRYYERHFGLFFRKHCSEEFHPVSTSFPQLNDILVVKKILIFTYFFQLWVIVGKSVISTKN